MHRITPFVGARRRYRCRYVKNPDSAALFPAHVKRFGGNQSA